MTMTDEEKREKLDELLSVTDNALKTLCEAWDDLEQKAQIRGLSSFLKLVHISVLLGPSVVDEVTTELVNTLRRQKEIIALEVPAAVNLVKGNNKLN